MHNADKVLMGTTLSKIRESSSHVGTVEAGYACHLKSDGTVTLLASDGVLIGVSLGKDGSNTNRTVVCRRGLGIPVVLTNSFNPTIGAQVSFSDTTGAAIAAGGGATATAAEFKRGRVDNGGIAEDGTTLKNIAIIDMIGGL